MRKGFSGRFRCRLLKNAVKNRDQNGHKDQDGHDTTQMA